MYGITDVAAITVVCYLMAEAVKASTIHKKWVPIICGLLGGILGIVALNVMPSYPAEDPLTAVAVGIVSGLAATGVYEAKKNLLEKYRDD